MMDRAIEETITDKTIEETIEIYRIIGKMTPDRGKGIEVRVERGQEITIVTILEVEIEIETDRYNKEPEHYQMTETGQGLGLDPTLS